MHHDVSDDVMIIKPDTGFISINSKSQIVYAESNGHVTNDVRQPHDVIVVT